MYTSPNKFKRSRTIGNILNFLMQLFQVESDVSECKDMRFFDRQFTIFITGLRSQRSSV